MIAQVEAIGMTTSSGFDLPQGTLDLLILRVVALGPVHGYAIAQRIQVISKEALQIQQGSLYPASSCAAPSRIVGIVADVVGRLATMQPA
jgi:hypothetical protein